MTLLSSFKSRDLKRYLIRGSLLNVLFWLVLTGCSKQDDKQIQSEDYFDEKDSRYISVDGYKDLKFGMTSVELAKTKSCERSYKYLTDLDRLPGEIKELKAKLSESKNLDDIARLQRDIEQAGKSIERDQELLHDHFKRNQVGERRPLIQIESGIEHQQNLLLEKKNRLAKLQEEDQAELNHPELKFNREIKPLIDRLELTKSYHKSVTDKWINNPQTICFTNIMGFDRRIKLGMSSTGTLSKITVELGEFADESYQEISHSLNEKYQQVYEPTSTQIALFNQNRLEQIARTFANSQISLTAYNYRSYRGYERSMELTYADISLASEIKALNSKGTVSKGDL